MTRSEELIADVHPHLDPDPLPHPVVQLQPTAPAILVIDDHYLEVTLDAAAPIRILLEDHTLTTLVAALPVALGATVADSTWSNVKAYCLIPVASVRIVYGDALLLSAYTSPLWRLMRPIANELRKVEESMTDLLRQTNVRLATGMWLEMWGTIWDVQRLAGEQDVDYQRRIIYSMIVPRSSLSGIVNLLNGAFGVQLALTNGASGTFGITMYEPRAAFDDILIFIKRHKAAGTSVGLVVVYSPVGTFGFNRVRGLTEY